MPSKEHLLLVLFCYYVVLFPDVSLPLKHFFPLVPHSYLLDCLSFIFMAIFHCLTVSSQRCSITEWMNQTPFTPLRTIPSPLTISCNGEGAFFLAPKSLWIPITTVSTIGWLDLSPKESECWAEWGGDWRWWVQIHSSELSEYTVHWFLLPRSLELL